MTPRANADGKRCEKIEPENNLRTVECLRGRLLAERVASRNANEEVEQMENKLIGMEKKLQEESKSRNRAEKKLKFLMKKLESLNIPYVYYESEQSGSGSGSLEKSEISSVVSSVTSSISKEVEDKEINSNVRNFRIGDPQEFIENSGSPPKPVNLQQNVCSSSGNHDNPAAEKTTYSGTGVNLPQLSIQKEEIKEVTEKSQSPTASNNSEQNACSFAKNLDNPAAEKIISPLNDANFPEITIQKEEIEVLEEKSESSSVSNSSEQNAIASPKNDDNPAAGETIGYSHSVNFPEQTIKKEEIEKFKVQTESPMGLINCEQNDSPLARNHDAGGTIQYSNTINFPELTMKKKDIEEFEVKTESPMNSIISEENSSSWAKYHDNPVPGETIKSRNGADFLELTTEKEEINEFKVMIESPTVSIKSEQSANTINQCHDSPITQLEIHSHVEAHSAKSSEPRSSQKAKKDDHSLRTLFKKEKLNEENEQEQDYQVDNSLALVPVALPKKKESIDPVVLDATVKQVLGALRNAKEKLQTSMERRRSNMIKVG